MSKFFQWAVGLVFAAGASTALAAKPVPNAPPTVSLTSPASGATFVAPATINLAADAADSNGTISKVDFYRGKKLIGTATVAPYSFTWTNVAAGSYSLTAKATDNGGASTTSSAVSITVSSSPPNPAPTVSLTSPVAGSSFTAPASINLAASASDSNGTVTKVDFYQGTVLLGSSTAPPYVFTWNNVSAGSYSLTARATDNGGATATSAAVPVTVSAPNNNITISSPTDGATVYDSSLTVTGTFVSGTNTSVLVDNGSTSRVATVSNNTYSATVPLNVGDNTLTVSVARSDKTSDTKSITVKGNLPPLVVITSPGSAPLAAPANVTLAADAVSPGGAISNVAFYTGSTLLGTVTSPPYQLAWNNVASGSYTIAVAATDSAGQTGTATQVVQVGAPNQQPSVSLTSPVQGATFTEPAIIAINANASDPDGSVAQVEFLQNGNVIGATNVAPYAFTWTGVAAGTYSLAARVTDNAGASATSAPVSVTVQSSGGGGGEAPVTITSPAPGASLLTHRPIQLAAAVEGQVYGVKFYTQQGGVNTLIGESASSASPYTFSWSTTTAGSYTFVASALVQVQGFPMPMEVWSDPVTVTVALNTAGQITYLHHDLAGSVIGATDAAGNLLWKEDYRPYGERIVREPASASNRQFYAGHSLDTDTGLSYMGARYYDPSVGRFIAVDEIGFVDQNLHSFNRFAYANNNPFKFADPTGKYGELVVEGMSLAVGFHNLGGNLRSGNYTAAAVDAVGIVVDAVGAAVPVVPGVAGLGIKASREGAELGYRETVGSLRATGKKDAHHAIQDASVRDLPGYNTNAAPGIQLPGPANVKGTPHNLATAVQRQAGGGTYAAERRIGYKAMRRAGVPAGEARSVIRQADEYFEGIGVGPQTVTRIPGNR